MSDLLMFHRLARWSMESTGRAGSCGSSKAVAWIADWMSAYSERAASDSLIDDSTWMFAGGRVDVVAEAPRENCFSGMSLARVAKVPVEDFRGESRFGKNFSMVTVCCAGNRVIGWMAASRRD